MSTERVRAFLDEHAPALRVVETTADTSTVETAAAALGVQPAQIAKTLAMRAGDRLLLVVARGDARVDNAKFRQTFGAKPRMLAAPETEALTGQPVGGVSPFGHPEPLDVHLDESLRAFDLVYPAGGSRNSAVPVEPDELARITGGRWVDVTRVPALDDERPADPA